MLPRALQSRRGRYGLVLPVVALAALCRYGIVVLAGDARSTAFGPFYAAIVAITLVGGLGPGVLALALSIGGSLWLYSPRDWPPPSATLPTLIFAAVGGLVVWLAHLTRSARLAAERAEHRAQTVLDSIPDSFVALDFSWRYTYVNDAAQAWLGRTADDLVGRNCWEAFPHAVGTPMEGYYRQVMEGREPLTIDVPSVMQPGRLVQLRVIPSAEGISVTFRDVTEERRLRDASLRHQERMHRALEAARMAAYEYDLQADRLTYSGSASDVLGIPADLLPTTRRDGTALIHPEDREAHTDIVRRASRTAEGQYQSQYRLADEYLLGRSGPVWIEDRGRLLFDSVGQLLKVQGVMQDVTEQRATEARIHALNQDLRDRIAERQSLLEGAEASREAAERSSRAKDEFLAVLSHELRAPMQSVLGWVQVLRGSPMEGPAAGRALDTIERNLRQQTQLINDMLDVSRIVTGKLVFHLTTLALTRVVRETIDELKPLADAKGLAVDVTMGQDLLVVGDRERVRQVVSNLFTNAVKFTPAGGRVTVGCRAEAGTARLEVRDTGDGIAADMLPSIFERFRQADSSSTRQHEGLGLGLSITRYIVEHLGGTIGVESAGPGKGATFTVYLPLAPSPPPAPSARRATPDQASPRLDGLEVLVVDDHRDTVDLIAFVLQRQGAVVRTAGSAQEALALWRRTPTRVLVTDLSMPGMDGFELLATLLVEAQGPVAAIALSGLARADDRQRALMAGFAAHLAKPVEPDVLVETLEHLVPRAATSG